LLLAVRDELEKERHELDHVVLHTATLFLRRATLSAQQFLLLEAEITQGETYYVSAKSQ
jgi:hypothetical protein